MEKSKTFMIKQNKRLVGIVFAVPLLWLNFEIEILDMDSASIDKVLLTKKDSQFTTDNQ